MNTKATIEKRARRAIEALKRGKKETAHQILDELIKTGVNAPEIMALMGVVKMELQRFQEAVDFFDKALAIKPGDISALYNRARALQILGRLKEAEEAYRELTRKEPSFPHAWNNLGLIFKETGRLAEAQKALERAVTLAPDQPYFLNNLGVVSESLGRDEEALKLFSRAVSIHKDYFSARFNLGCLLFRLGRYKDAEKHLLWVLSVKEDEPTARFLLQSLGHFKPPERAPTQYVKKTFDDWAAQFEEKLVKELHYQTPEQLFHFLKPLICQGSNILDLGCGTGLGAEFYRPFATFLAGMDCSEKMLEKARNKKIYDALYQHDIAEPWPTKNSFHLIYSADCLCYFGQLQTVFKRVWESLSQDGIFGFSLECAPKAKESEDGYILGPSGRYAHREDYVISTLKKAGFEPLSHQKVILRKEAGKDVQGFLYAARKANP